MRREVGKKRNIRVFTIRYYNILLKLCKILHPKFFPTHFPFAIRKT